MPSSSSPALPPRVVAVRNAVFEAPDEAGLSIAVPTSYSLTVSAEAPVSTYGRNGDWYIQSSTTSLKAFRKVVGLWTQTSNITGSGGGGGGGSGLAFDDAEITDSSFEDGTISGTAITSSSWAGGTISGATISSAAITTATITSPTISTPSVVGGTLTGVTVNSSTWNGGTITGLPAPVALSDAANKAYVDGISSGVVYHEAVRVATNANITTLAGGAPNTLDGVSLLINNRVLVKNQADPKLNGIYYISVLGSGSNGTWVRATDADTGAEMPTGSYVLVTEGSTYAGSAWIMNTPGTITLGVSDIVWVLYGQGLSIPDGSIGGNKITPGALDKTRFASSLTPVEIVSSMPTTDNIHGRLVFLTTVDGAFAANKLYRWTSNSVTTGTAFWTAAIPAVDITGNLTNDQIENLNAAKLTGTITTTVIGNSTIQTANLDAGCVKSAQIFGGAIIAGKLSAGAVVAGNIATDAVTANTIEANAVIFGKIQAGAVRANEIDVDAILSRHIVGNQILAEHIESDSIETRHIGADQVTAGKILVDDLATINPNLGTITAGIITSNVSLDVGSGTARTRISAADGLEIGSARITAKGDGSNPWFRVFGTGSYATHRVEINGLNGTVSGAILQATDGTNIVTISSTGGNVTLQGGNLTMGGGNIIVGASSGIIGTGGGQINLQGGNSDALDIVCGEAAGTITPDGVLELKVNGRTVKVEFEEA
jgi:hypothetical protein